MLTSTFSRSIRLGVFASLLLLASRAAEATIYRIGPDAAGPGVTAFKSIADFMNATKCVLPGDEIQLQEKIAHFGRLQLVECSNTSGLSAGSLRIRSFTAGSAADQPPVEALTSTWIFGSTKVSTLGLTWERVDTPTYRGKVVRHLVGRPVYRVGPLASPVKQFYYRLSYRPSARYPSSANLQAPNYVMATGIWPFSTTGCQAGTCLRSDSDPAASALLKEYGFDASTYAVVRNSPWSVTRSQVTWVNPNTTGIALADSIAADYTGWKVADAGHGFILVNSLAFMDEPGEWFSDPETSYLYFYSPETSGAAPVESESLLGFDISDNSNFNNAAVAFSGRANGRITQVRVLNISILAAAGDAIRISSVPNTEVNSVSVYGANGDGLRVTNFNANVTAQTATIRNSKIRRAANSGVRVAGVQRVEVTSNIIEDNGFVGNQDVLGMQFSGINVGSYFSAAVSGNTVRRSGYAGIQMTEPKLSSSVQSSLQVNQNLVDRFLELLNDGGGIYINGGGLTVPQILTSGKVVDGNTITNPVGNLNGTPAGFGYSISPDANFGPTTGSGRRMVGAVYLDHKASYYQVSNNQIEGYYEPFTWFVRNGGKNNSSLNNILNLPNEFLAEVIVNGGERIQFAWGFLVMQKDGDLVLTDNNGVTLWRAGVSFPADSSSQYRVIFQHDGNLVLYKNGWTPYWASNTWGNPGATLKFSPTAPFITIVSSTGQALWSASP